MWKEVNNSLYKRFVFKDFIQAMTFMNAIAFRAEAMQHHPLWTNVYNQVEIWLSTHDAGNTVTEKDRKLSKVIDEVFEKFNDSIK